MDSGLGSGCTPKTSVLALPLQVALKLEVSGPWLQLAVICSFPLQDRGYNRTGSENLPITTIAMYHLVCTKDL